MNKTSSEILGVSCFLCSCLLAVEAYFMYMMPTFNLSSGVFEVLILLGVGFVGIIVIGIILSWRYGETT